MIEQCTIRDIIPIMICQWSSHRVDIAVSLAKPSDEKTDYNFRLERFSGKPNFFFPQKESDVDFGLCFHPRFALNRVNSWVVEDGHSFILFCWVEAGSRCWRFSFSPGVPLLSFPHSCSHPSLVMSLRAVPSRALDRGVW